LPDQLFSALIFLKCPLIYAEVRRSGRRLPPGTRQRVGWYRFYFADERWEWSPEVEQIHGYQPGTVNPTPRLVLSHKHPDDY